MKDLKPGSSFTAFTEFYTDTGSPLTLSSAPEYSVRDESQSLVTSGIGEQTNQAQRWQALISLPETLLPGTYNVIWVGKTPANKQVNREQFTIVDATPNYYELDLLVPERGSVVDVLKAESGETITNVTVEIIMPEGNPIYASSSANITNSAQGDQQLFKLQTPKLDTLLAGGSAFALYLINWNFTVDGQPQTEHHFVYVVNPKVLVYVNELKRMIDKAGIQNPNVALRYNNVDLVAYLNQGLQWVNLQGPQHTSYTLANLPDNLYIYVLYAAAVHALESRLMAEAEAAFNFNGQPITLEVDRTAYIESAIGRYQEKLGNLDGVKKVIAMSGGGDGGGMGYASANSMGVLSISQGSLTSYSIFPWYNNRVAGYQDMLYNLGYNY